MRCLISLLPTLFERDLCSNHMLTQGIPELTISVACLPFWLVTGNLRSLVSAQSDKATGFVVCATHRWGQPRSPDLPPDDNDVFSDSARRAVGAQKQQAVFADSQTFNVTIALLETVRLFTLMRVLVTQGYPRSKAANDMGWKVSTALVTGVLSLSAAIAQDHPVLIHGARVFDGKAMLGKRDVLLSNGRIAAVGRALRVPSNAEVIDGRGRTLIPGLIDGHVHVFPGAQGDALRFGVTTMFDMYSIADAATIKGWRQQRSSYGRVAEADTFTAGVGATPPGGHPIELFAGQPDAPMPPTLATDADENAFMAARVAGGSDYIKILQDDGARPGRRASLPAFSSERFAAIIRSAKATGKLVVVHVQQLADARVAVAGNVDVIEHAICDAPLDPALVKSIVAKGIAQTATLAVYDGISGADDARRLVTEPVVAPYLSDTQRGMLSLVWPRPRPSDFTTALANTRRLARAGAVMVAGTDAPNPTTAFGPSLHLELALLVRAGLTPIQALTAATSAPARIFHTADRGRIGKGMRADLVLVEGDPTKRIIDTRRIVTIWKNGYTVDRHVGAAPPKS